MNYRMHGATIKISTQYLLKPTNCTYLSNHLKPHYWMKHEHNILFDHVSITLPTKYSDTALTAGEEHRPNQTDIT